MCVCACVFIDICAVNAFACVCARRCKSLTQPIGVSTVYVTFVYVQILYNSVV